MIPAKRTVLLALGALSILAQDFSDENSNFTFTLYPSDAGDTCEEGGKGGLTLTTRTVPRVLTCIDVEAMFSSNNRTGFLNDTSSHLVTDPDGFDESRLPPPGIDFYIPSGLGDYNASKNWTNLWFRQRNATGDGETEEGELGRWIITTYANNECIRTNVTETPWYETSCQTDEEGQCESVSYSIKSIGMRPFDGKNGDFADGCQEWGRVGAAASLMPHLSAALVGVMAYFVLL
ncbi:hypothetical protein B0T11DRAFT_298708 [Plectosphaerella cucumerina]|uniref:Uncharacterized protein n=1 Tax=Plectosphaerella cucumerina TaxID=40658 RepID=A0A8K0X638_9PEZI|nr:hypothetical protein B0T11DRAFT_298708 [Plectosphaerella cucumerina]